MSKNNNTKMKDIRILNSTATNPVYYPITTNKKLRIMTISYIKILSAESEAWEAMETAITVANVERRSKIFISDFRNSQEWEEVNDIFLFVFHNWKE